MIEMHINDGYRNVDYKYAGIIVLNETQDKMLLVKGRVAQKWGPPKGHICAGETCLKAAVRETYEETGINITYNDCYKNLYNRKLYRLNILDIIFYVCSIPESTKINIKDINEIDAYKWEDIKCLVQLNKSTRFKDNYNSPIRYMLNTENKYSNILKIIHYIKKCIK
jgi:8-oxo-dGTP pyrophosphatase MutT (NUDIX family)